MNDQENQIRRLRRDRSRNRFSRISGGILLAMMIGSWFLGDFHLNDLLSPHRRQNFVRFLNELKPYPLQAEGPNRGSAVDWAVKLFKDKGWSATVTTLAISVAAIVLAGFGGLLASLLAARNLASAEPFLPSLRSSGRHLRILWRSIVTLTRFVLIFARAIPEYLWAFLFLALFGQTAWPAVLALALHNLGILGRLCAEILENLEDAPLAGLRGLGATRSQIVVAAIFPLTFSRFLLFFFYRWETCVREATVLGLLGIVSLGYWIQDARARNHYDDMLFLILLGAGLVMLGDLLSALARGLARRS